MNEVTVPVHLIIPFEIPHTNEGLFDQLHTLNELGISFNDVIAEAISLASVCLNPNATEDDLIPNIDTGLVEHIVEAHAQAQNHGQTPDMNQYQNFVGQVWNDFTDVVVAVFRVLFPYVRNYLNQRYPNLNEGGHEYRCSDVRVEKIQSLRDSIVVNFTLFFTGASIHDNSPAQYI